MSSRCKKIEKEFIRELVKEIKKKGVRWIEYIVWPEGARAIKTNIGHVEEDEELADLIDKLVNLDLEDWEEISPCESKIKINSLEIKYVIMC